MKLSKGQRLILIVAAVSVSAYLIYEYVFKKGNKRGAAGTEGIPDADGWYYFQYAGGSALQTSDNCDTSQMEEGDPYPTTFYGFLEIGKWENGSFVPFANANCTENDLCRILPGDKINSIEILSGADNSNLPWDAGSYDVLQLGTDACTPGNQILYLKNGILIDLPVVEGGSTDQIYDVNGQIFGRFKLDIQ